MNTSLVIKLTLASLLSITTAQTAFTQASQDSSLVANDSTTACAEDEIPDTDRDTIPDAVETTADTDNDGIPNYLDTDSDNDAIPDALESGGYARPWKVGGYTDTTEGCVSKYWGTAVFSGGVTVNEDSSIVVNGVVHPFPYDMDDNGVADFLLDANANNVADYLEPAPAAHTAQTDPCIALGGYTDTDRDLIADVIEGSVDTDGDGTPDYLDADSDNDGLSDYWEGKTIHRKIEYDSDFDGIISSLDTDDTDRTVACIVNTLEPADANGNGVFDYLEAATVVTEANDPCAAHYGATDSDGDWIPDFRETDADTDADGIPNYLDLDSDNDGLTDRYEYNPAEEDVLGIDADRDGVVHNYDLDDNNPQIACIEPYTSIPDFKADNLPNYLDPDSDDDTLLDGFELSYNGIFTIDSDNDTLSDAYEVSIGSNPGNVDTDGAGANDDWEVLQGSDPNDATDDAGLRIDLDVDNDGIADTLENNLQRIINRDTDGDGRSDTLEAGLPDADNDGFIDDLTDTNANGLADIAEGLTELPDFDGDGVADLFDIDSDNDSIDDRFEFNFVVLPPSYTADSNDVDGDGLLNMFDLDSDNDGVFDLREARGLTYVKTTPGGWIESDDLRDVNNDGQLDDLQDQDADGIPDHVDITYITTAMDTDEDGIADFADYSEIEPKTRTDVYGDEVSIIFDSNNNGIEDNFDPDRNNDGGFDHTKDFQPDWNNGTDMDVIPPVYDADDLLAFNPYATPENPSAQPTLNTGAATNINNTSGSSGGGGSFGVWLLLILGARSAKEYRASITPRISSAIEPLKPNH